MIDQEHRWNISITPLIVGFLLSLGMLCVAYYIVGVKHLRGWEEVLWIMGFAVIQALYQFVYFLHLGAENKPRHGLMIFGFMILITIIIIGGTLWIMANLSYDTQIPFPSRNY
ncbi:MAG: cytochrome C oxidase subunit IV family protein [Simkaniaceae bacterium]|nr:cytochrome C oxidase subunit IV family protein [Simkaniaceae bacterium]